MNLTPQQLSQIISKAVDATKANPAPVVQGIKRRLLRELAEQIAELAYKSTVRRERFIRACRIEELKEG